MPSSPSALIITSVMDTTRTPRTAFMSKPRHHASGDCSSENEENQVMPFNMDEEFVEERWMRNLKDEPPNSSWDGKRAKKSGRSTNQVQSIGGKELDAALSKDVQPISKLNHLQLDEKESKNMDDRNSSCTESVDGSSTKGSGRRDDENSLNEAKEEISALEKSIVHSVSPRLAPPPLRRRTSLIDWCNMSKVEVVPGSEHDRILGTIERQKSMLSTRFYFYVQDQLILMAERHMLKNRNPTYRLFDMTRNIAGMSGKLSKKSGNYMGKLITSISGKECVLRSGEKKEMAAVVFERTDHPSDPRKMSAILPINGIYDVPRRNYLADEDEELFSSLIDRKIYLNEDILLMKNKQPTFEKGCYRLDFNGRVSMPSVKNFQLFKPPQLSDETEEVCLLFGKVSETQFHLDFSSPLGPLQAFSIALAQFNL